jgi:NADPH:quinone reductase-like Zn-dependent oxidoreductase
LCREAGADDVGLVEIGRAALTESESIEERVRPITDGEGVSFALDAVGGETGSVVAGAWRMAAGSGYGTLAEEPLSLPSRMLFLGVKHIDGFWLSDWARRQNLWTMIRLFRRIHELMAKGVLSTDIGPVFPLDEIKAAVRQASTPGRNGKVLLKMSSAF